MTQNFTIAIDASVGDVLEALAALLLSIDGDEAGGGGDEGSGLQNVRRIK